MDLSFGIDPSDGEGNPSSLPVSPPVSEVAFEGADELIGVLLFVNALLTGSPALRMIVTAALPVGSGALVVSDPAIMLMLGGLLSLVAAKMSERQRTYSLFWGLRYNTTELLSLPTMCIKL